MKSLLNTAYEGADKGSNAIEYVNSSLPKAEDKVKEITSKLGDINNSQDLKEVLSILQEAVTERQNFMTSPVDLVEETIFPMHNYGNSDDAFLQCFSSMGRNHVINLYLICTCFR